MVAHTRTQGSPGTLRALNRPQPVWVEENPNGQPLSVRLGRHWIAMAKVADTWRIDDEWWRERPVSRMYHRVALKDGTMLGLFKDLETGRWCRQRV